MLRDLKTPSRSPQPQYLSPLTKLDLQALQDLRERLESLDKDPLYQLWRNDLQQSIEGHKLVLLGSDYQTHDSLVVMAQLIEKIKNHEESLRWHSDLLEDVKQEITTKENKDNETTN